MTAPRYGDGGFIDAYRLAWHLGGQHDIAAFFAEDGSYVDMACNSKIKPSEIPALIRSWAVFSPDSHFKFGRLVGDADAFAVDWRFAGTATGPMSLEGTDFTGTGGRFEVDGISLCVLNEDGLILSHTDYWDIAPLLAQTDAAGHPGLKREPD